jgi:hypothetical protein
MDMQQPALSSQYWYDKPGAVEVKFYGVFEGGGAKGVAYSGALLAMKEMKCWFSGVAGASAGAITATLVAAGLSPNEMEDATDAALRHVQTGIWAGFRRLHNLTGYFPARGLHAWLDDLLRQQVQRSTGIPSDTGVTFRQLFTATRIELTVVAADLSERRQIVFSHLETPNCSVADAVIASCSIPFAFQSRLLQVSDRNNGEVYHHTIVDGGVWSNFPLFIFEDAAFRRFYKRVPEQIESCLVLGFLLKDSPERPPLRGDDIKFLENVSGKEFHAREWGANNSCTGDGVSSESLGAKIGAWVLFPFSLLGRLLAFNSGVERGRWPTPRSGLIRNFVLSIDGLLGGIYPPLLGLLAYVVVVTGAWEVIVQMIKGIRMIEWTEPPFGLFFLGLALITIALTVLVAFVSLLGIVANFALLRAVRRILYGLVTTYVAGPGATDWVAKRRNIIALEIPPDVTTLSFVMPPEQRVNLVASAYRVTLERLREVLSDVSKLRSSNTVGSDAT